MTDAQRMAHWATITDPVEALGELLANSEFLGTDPYYRDLNDALLAMAERVHGAADKSKAPNRRVRHVKRGSTYDVLGEGEVQISDQIEGLGRVKSGRIIQEGDKLVVYRGEDGKLWIRFPDEFEDGRFEPIPEVTITPELVRALREKSGHGLMDCKAALKQTGGDFDAAVEWLRKKGWSNI